MNRGRNPGPLSGDASCRGGKDSSRGKVNEGILRTMWRLLRGMPGNKSRHRDDESPIRDVRACQGR